MTKVTILGQAEDAEPKKKIEFVKYLRNDKGDSANWVPIAEGQKADNWANICLLRLNYNQVFDLMYAFKGDGMYCLFLGHFNDGIV